MTEWTPWKWTLEKPYPETQDTMVRVVLDWEDPEKELNSKPDLVSEWNWDRGAGIIFYMVVDK